MFTRMQGKRGVTSDEGYSVVRGGSPITAFYIEYREAGRTLRYELDNLVAGAVDSIVVQSVGPWLPPHEKVPLSPQDQERIAERMCQAMAYLGDTVRVVSHRPGYS